MKSWESAEGSTAGCVLVAAILMKIHCLSHQENWIVAIGALSFPEVWFNLSLWPLLPLIVLFWWHQCTARRCRCLVQPYHGPGVYLLAKWLLFQPQYWPKMLIHPMWSMSSCIDVHVSASISSTQLFSAVPTYVCACLLIVHGVHQIHISVVKCPTIKCMTQIELLSVEDCSHKRDAKKCWLMHVRTVRVIGLWW